MSLKAPKTDETSSQKRLSKREREKGPWQSKNKIGIEWNLCEIFIFTIQRLNLLKTTKITKKLFLSILPLEV